MIYVGHQVQQTISCPTCGKACRNSAVSTQLVTVCCTNEVCEDSYAAFIVDRSTGVIMWSEAHLIAWVKGLQKEGKP